jgi:hypothetical protein
MTICRISGVIQSSHDLYGNPKTGKNQPVPRHNEIDEILAKHIIRELE